jgi:O-antigen/teichoic acid export membrane protein
VTASAEASTATDGSLVARVLSTFGTRILLTGIAALTGIIIARALGPTGRGEYYVIATVSAIAVSVGHLSVEQAQMYLWGELRERRRALIANAVVLAGLLGIMVAAVTWAVVTLLGPDRVPLFSTVALLLGLAVIPVSLLVLWNNNLLLLAGRVDRYNRGILLAAVVQCGLLVGLTVTGHISTLAVVVVWAATSGLSLLVSMATLRPRFQDVSLPLVARAVRTGLRYHAGLAAFFLLLRLDVVLLNGLVSPRDVGLYSVAVTMAELVWLFTDSVANAVVSRQADSDMAGSARVTAASVRFGMVGATLLTLGMGVSSPLLLPLLYGEAFAPAVIPLVGLLPGVVGLALSRPVGAYLLRLNRPILTAGSAGAAAVLNVVLIFVLVPRVGIVGASIASSAAYVLLAVAYLALFRHFADLRWRDFLPRRNEVAGLARHLAGAASKLSPAHRRGPA